ncbi:glyoxylate/hydroxypyruvate reductase A-like [Panonychus citri]|uniref:glyoxylate/hydroxypyruvate reductase A-like n=1 Tax=Panonychus citri TaxID=50023 RepID=UPI002307263F|nr:glyoxylate/hydroxypyruvate reductase A-like [Panonychus citri]
MSQIVYILSQLNADKVKLELEKLYPPSAGNVTFKLCPISGSKKGIFLREHWLESSDLDKLKDAELIIADNMYWPQLVTSCPKLKWIQGTYAGVDTVFKRLPKFLKPGHFPVVPATRFSGPSFGKLMSDYCLGYIIGIERNFIKFRDNQSSRDWSVLLKQQDGLIYRSLDELKVSILGFGAIGKDMARCFTAMGCHVTAFARSESGKNEVGRIIERFTTNLNEALTDTDYIVAILPDTPETIGLLNGEALKTCSARKPTLINVGRGSLIGSIDVINALDNGWISTAVLDVFETEPLPPDNPLWTHPRVVITPHISALTKPKDLAQVFSRNFEHFTKGEPLELQINWETGY